MKTASQSKQLKIIALVLQVALAVVFIMMGAIPKLMGQFPSPQMFEKLGAEPMGRYFVGGWELISAILILIPKTAVIGASLIALAMVGAFASHVGKLGMMAEFISVDPEVDPVTVPGFLSLALLAVAVVVVFLRRDELPIVGKKKAA